MMPGDYRLPFEPQLLAAFLAVADRGSVSGAALFERRPRGMSPTEAGCRLLAVAERAQAELGEAARGLARAAEPEGLLSLWASTMIASYVLPPLLTRFAAAHPRVRVRLVSANTEEVLERVRSGAAELGLVEGHGRAPGVRLPAFVEDELIAVADPSFAPRRGGIAALSERPVLWRERSSGTRAVVERALREAGAELPREPRFELASTEAIKTAAIAGLGIAFLSRWSMRRELALGLLKPVPGRGLSVRRTFRWALAGGGLAGVARRFYDDANRRPPALSD